MLDPSIFLIDSHAMNAQGKDNGDTIGYRTGQCCLAWTRMSNLRGAKPPVQLTTNALPITESPWPT